MNETSTSIQPHAGGAPAGNPPASSTHSVAIGYILWIFGFTGAHRFYYGKPISGAIWLFTGGLLGIGWLIDLFLIPGMDRKADLRYATGRYDYSTPWLLQTFAGPLGLHRMYLGKWVSGFVYLFTGGLLLVGWIYDFCTLNGQVDEQNRA
ncbi:MAG: TM2 domain-containing protein [Verrucomicrobiae bacterium]|nr:TM2 domain-containing protein [Verrucomicrobiae bacterium]